MCLFLCPCFVPVSHCDHFVFVCGHFVPFFGSFSSLCCRFYISLWSVFASLCGNCLSNNKCFLQAFSLTSQPSIAIITWWGRWEAGGLVGLPDTFIRKIFSFKQPTCFQKYSNHSNQSGSVARLATTWFVILLSPLSDGGEESAVGGLGGVWVPADNAVKSRQTIILMTLGGEENGEKVVAPGRH